jgi:transposase
MIITLLKWPPRRGRNTTGSRTAPKPFLNDSQWLLIADVFRQPPTSSAGGRPRVEPRPCLEGILWILASGARWQDLPERYPSPATCWRRLREWTDNGAFLKAWRRLLGKLDRLKGLNWDEAIGDGSFSRAKRGAPRLSTAAKAKARP